MPPLVQYLDPLRTTWHITVGTYGSRLHGANEPTVDLDHNELGTPFLPPDPARHAFESERMRGNMVLLNTEQRLAIEAAIPLLCERGGWIYRVAAAPGPPDCDHFHLLCDAAPAVHGKQIREWLKRWLTQHLNERFGPPPGGTAWWVKGGSTKPVKQLDYLNNAFPYIWKQRTTEA